jgi:prepilin-type N-terminal cleavage/methylation domain-containing protein
MMSAAQRRGFTLIELLCVIFLVSVLAGIMAVMLKETLGMQRAQTDAFDSVLHSSALADRFRADVAAARTAPGSWQKYQAGVHTMILEMPDESHVIYIWDKDTLTRHVFGKDSSAAALLPTDEGRVEFVRANSGPKLIRLRVIAPESKGPTVRSTIEIAAALGGDWR